MPSSLPASYNTLSLPQLLLSHNPPSSPSPTPIITISLHRPSSRNAFTPAMATSLITAFTTLSADPRVKVIVLTSSDPSNRIFCAGMDLAGSKGRSAGMRESFYDDGDSNGKNSAGESQRRNEYRDQGGQVALAIYNCAKPVIAAINGSAVGVGITMTLPCSIRIASRTSKIGFVFSRRGFTLEACSSFFLPRLIGTSAASHLLTTGSVLPATHKHLSPLFTETVEPEEVLPTALRMAEGIARNVSTLSAAVMKDMIYRGGRSPEEAHLLESRVFYDLFRGKDAKEGVESFREKRLPEFDGTMERDGPTAWPWWTQVDVADHKAKI